MTREQESPRTQEVNRFIEKCKRIALICSACVALYLVTDTAQQPSPLTHSTEQSLMHSPPQPGDVLLGTEGVESLDWDFDVDPSSVPALGGDVVVGVVNALTPGIQDSLEEQQRIEDALQGMKAYWEQKARENDVFLSIAFVDPQKAMATEDPSCTSSGGAVNAILASDPTNGIIEQADYRHELLNHVAPGLGEGLPTITRNVMLTAAIKERCGGDSVVLLYLVHGQNESFAQQTVGAANYLGPEAIVSTKADYLLQILKHELGHLFGALDKYYLAGTSCDRRGGTYGFLNANSQYAGLNPAACDPQEQANTDELYIFVLRDRLSSYTLGQIGWAKDPVSGDNMLAGTIVYTQTVPYDPDNNGVQTLSGELTLIPDSRQQISPAVINRFMPDPIAVQGAGVLSSTIEVVNEGQLRYRVVVDPSQVHGYRDVQMILSTVFDMNMHPFPVIPRTGVQIWLPYIVYKN